MTVSSAMRYSSSLDATSRSESPKAEVATLLESTFHAHLLSFALLWQSQCLRERILIWRDLCSDPAWPHFCKHQFRDFKELKSSNPYSKAVQQFVGDPVETPNGY